jgi:hypothetical protein
VLAERNWKAFSTSVGCSVMPLRPTRLYARPSVKQQARLVELFQHGCAIVTAPAELTEPTGQRGSVHAPRPPR